MPDAPHLHIVQPQREGDGRQALVVPPLYPAPAASLKSSSFTPQKLDMSRKQHLLLE